MPDSPTPKTPRARSKSKAASVSSEAFADRQLVLFQGLYSNSEEKRESLSNAIDLWDSVPRYSTSRLRMSAARTPDGFLPVLEVAFSYRGRSLTAAIYPAQLKTKNGKRLSYYPSAREELIEHALRRICTEQQSGFFDRPRNVSGARFSLYQLRQELIRQGHALRYDELVEGLDILSLSSIEIIAPKDDVETAFARSTYLSALAGVRRSDFDADRTARWTAHFHPLVTQSIDRVTYRQFNYQRLMRCSTQIARWLMGQLVVKYTQAALINSFEMRFSTIKRNSALMEGYKRNRDAIAAIDEAWEELKALGALAQVNKVEQRGAHGKIEDVIYTLVPSREFVAEQKAANRRQSDARQEDAAPMRSRLDHSHTVLMGNSFETRIDRAE